MLTESLDTGINGSIEQTTAYGYTGTQQAAKFVYAGSQVSNSALSNRQTYTYDVQGRMYRAVTETFTSGTLATRSRATYRYGTDGIRFQATEETDTVLSLTTENWQLTTDTKYLIDVHNPTGYQQVLEETATDANGVVTSKIVYTIGLDHISQTKYAPSPGGEGWGEGVTHIFHMDGHGSTRVLTDPAGAILNVAGKLQAYHFNAYGNALNFTMSEAATQYLYSGEQFDSRIGQQYLRARYYDSAIGTFNKLDPFFGNQNDPQSFHKYLYTHGDPIGGWDPSGNEFSLAGSLASSSIGGFLNAVTGEAGLTVLNYIQEQRANYASIGISVGLAALPLVGHLAGFILSRATSTISRFANRGAIANVIGTIASGLTLGYKWGQTAKFADGDAALAYAVKQIARFADESAEVLPQMSKFTDPDTLKRFNVIVEDTPSALLKMEKEGALATWGLGVKVFDDGKPVNMKQFIAPNGKYTIYLHPKVLTNESATAGEILHEMHEILEMERYMGGVSFSKPDFVGWIDSVPVPVGSPPRGGSVHVDGAIVESFLASWLKIPGDF